MATPAGFSNTVLNKAMDAVVGNIPGGRFGAFEPVALVMELQRLGILPEPLTPEEMAVAEARALWLLESMRGNFRDTAKRMYQVRIARFQAGDFLAIRFLS